jgi:hypothetical protein
MEWFRAFSKDYADGVTAVVAVVALMLTAFTLWYLRREYRAKYRPLVTAAAALFPIKTPSGDGFSVAIKPRSLGTHPCFAKFTDIVLQIGDELHPTPSNQNWMLIGAAAEGIVLPIGQINPEGIQWIREARYSVNRVEARFILHTKSAENEFESAAEWGFEIDVRAEPPQVGIRPERANVIVKQKRR